MAKRIAVGLVDDITGQPAATTVRFGLDGATYEIDLADDQPLRATLAPWICAARPADGQPPRRHDLHLIRQWARHNGHRVPARGPLPAPRCMSHADSAVAAASNNCGPFPNNSRRLMWWNPSGSRGCAVAPISV